MKNEEISNKCFISKNDRILTMPKIKKIVINLDQNQFENVEQITLTRFGKTIIFPLWEFWQTLEKQDDIDNKIYGESEE